MLVIKSKSKSAKERANDYIKIFLLVTVCFGIIITLKSSRFGLEYIGLLTLIVCVLAFIFVGLSYLFDEDVCEIIFDDNQSQIVLKFRGSINNKQIRELVVSFDELWFSYQIEPVSNYSTAKVLRICNKKAHLVRVYGNDWSETDVIALVDEMCKHNLNGKVEEMGNGASGKFVYLK